MRRSLNAVAMAGLIAAASAAFFSAPAAAGNDENPDGYGFYTPLAGKRGTYRYDPRSWYYRQPGFYPNYSSNYWVPRKHMRYRYRYAYYGPKYQYYPAWGYPKWGYPEPGCCRWDWLRGW
jgi:hypothetical protein